MFKKALIAEDHESSNISVRSTLENLGIAQDYRYYCDDAYKAVQLAIKQEEPYDLLITDLSFEEDQNIQKIVDGEALIKAVREIQPNLKVIVFSIESSVSLVDQLFEKLEINAYVRKARHDAEHLAEAVKSVYGNKKYRSPDLRQSAKNENAYEWTNYDIKIVSLLYEGIAQKNIPDHLRKCKLGPSSLSSVEKRLNAIRNALNFSTNGQVIAYCREKKII